MKLSNLFIIDSLLVALQPLLGPGAFFSSVVIFTQAVGLVGRVISPSKGRYLHTRQHKHRINAHTNIHALSGTRSYTITAFEEAKTESSHIYTLYCIYRVPFNDQ
jgi:hypothetical protein